MLKSIATYIATELSLTLGTDIQTGNFTDSQTSPASCIKDTGGQVDRYAPDEQVFRFQIITRADSYFAARDRAYAIHAVIQNLKGQTLPTVETKTFVVLAVPTATLPQSLGSSDGLQEDFSSNYIFTACLA